MLVRIKGSIITQGGKTINFLKLQQLVHIITTVF